MKMLSDNSFYNIRMLSSSLGSIKEYSFEIVQAWISWFHALWEQGRKDQLKFHQTGPFFKIASLVHLQWWNQLFAWSLNSHYYHHVSTSIPSSLARQVNSSQVPQLQYYSLNFISCDPQTSLLLSTQDCLSFQFLSHLI